MLDDNTLWMVNSIVLGRVEVEPEQLFTCGEGDDHVRSAAPDSRRLVCAKCAVLGSTGSGCMLTQRD